MVPVQTFLAANGEREPNIAVKSENGELVGMEAADGLMCTGSCEDNMYVASPSHLRKVDDASDQKIDVLNCSGNGVVGLVKDEDPDATEYSSSFGDTCSWSDHESKRDFGDMEVDSPFVGVNVDHAPPVDGFNRVFRKKKVTAHWRKFISPLMWRCQWLELRIKELLSQASKYDKELASYKQEKDLQSKMVELDSSVSKLAPLDSQGRQKKLMKRRKRKRIEDKADILSYMSNHVIFSYYENKRTETDGHSIDDDCNDIADENIKGNDDNEWLLGLKGSDSYVEQILENIDSIQSRVFKLKAHLNKFICKNARLISSSPGNLFPRDPIASYALSGSGSPKNIGAAIPTGFAGTPPHHDYEMEDIVMPESAVSSYGDAADLDIVESTVGLLSAADVTLDNHQMGDLCKESADDVLIDNQVAEEEYQNFEKVSQAKEKFQELAKKGGETLSADESTAPKVPMPASGVESEKVDVPQQSVPKPLYSGKPRGRKPKKKKKQGGSVAGSASTVRGERIQKSGSGNAFRSGRNRIQTPGSGSIWRSERIRKRRLLGKVISHV